MTNRLGGARAGSARAKDTFRSGLLWTRGERAGVRARALARPYVRALSAQGWPWAGSAGRWLLSPPSDRFERTALARDGSGHALAWVRWSRTRERGFGRRLTGLALPGVRAGGTALASALDGFAALAAEEGPVQSVPALVPQVPRAPKRAVFRARGFLSAVRTDLVFPPDAPLPPLGGERDAPGRVRTLRRDDASRVARLLRAAYADDPRERAMFAEFRDPARDARFAARQVMGGGLGRWLARASFGREAGGRLVGATLANRFAGPLVSQVVTDPGYRGRGIASDLLARTVAVLRRTERSAPRLVVTEENDRAFRLYRRLGFVPRRGVRGEVWIHRDAIASARDAR